MVSQAESKYKPIERNKLVQLVIISALNQKYNTSEAKYSFLFKFPCLQLDTSRCLEYFGMILKALQTLPFKIKTHPSAKKTPKSSGFSLLIELSSQWDVLF